MYKPLDEKIDDGYTVLVFNRGEWLAAKWFGWTEEDLDNADEHGLIGIKFGVKCYLARPIKTVSS